MTAKTKFYFVGFCMMGMLSIIGTLFVLFYRETFGTWFVCLFGIYGFIRFGFDICRWLAKDAPEAKKTSKKELKIEAAEREALKRNFADFSAEVEA